MTPPQQATINTLQREGFTVEYRGKNVIRVAHGNDYRLVKLDGSQQRAKGARRT